jgi:hypothetical protein
MLNSLVRLEILLLFISISTDFPTKFFKSMLLEESLKEYLPKTQGIYVYLGIFDTFFK